MLFSSYSTPLGTVDVHGWKCVLGWRCVNLRLGSFEGAYRLPSWIRIQSQDWCVSVHKNYKHTARMYGNPYTTEVNLEIGFLSYTYRVRFPIELQFSLCTYTPRFDPRFAKILGLYVCILKSSSVWRRSKHTPHPPTRTPTTHIEKGVQVSCRPYCQNRYTCYHLVRTRLLFLC